MGLAETLKESIEYEIIFSKDYDTPNIDKKQFYVNPEDSFEIKVSSLMRQMVMINPVYITYAIKRFSGFRDNHEENSIDTVVKNIEQHHKYVRDNLSVILTNRLAKKD